MFAMADPRHIARAGQLLQPRGWNLYGTHRCDSDTGKLGATTSRSSSGDVFMSFASALKIKQIFGAILKLVNVVSVN